MAVECKILFDNPESVERAAWMLQNSVLKR